MATGDTLVVYMCSVNLKKWYYHNTNLLTFFLVTRSFPPGKGIENLKKYKQNLMVTARRKIPGTARRSTNTQGGPGGRGGLSSVGTSTLISALQRPTTAGAAGWSRAGGGGGGGGGGRPLTGSPRSRYLRRALGVTRVHTRSTVTPSIFDTGNSKSFL